MPDKPFTWVGRSTRLAQVLGLSCVLSCTAEATPSAAQMTAIRQNYALVNEKVNSRQYRLQTRTFDYCAGVVNQERKLWTDAVGVPRLYVESGGSEDSAVTISHYLDSRGELSFVLIEWGSVWKLAYSLRLYFDPAGRVIHRLEQGTRWNAWEPSVRRDVRAAFNAPEDKRCSSK